MKIMLKIVLNWVFFGRRNTVRTLTMSSGNQVSRKKLSLFAHRQIASGVAKGAGIRQIVSVTRISLHARS